MTASAHEEYRHSGHKYRDADERPDEHRIERGTRGG